MKRLDQRPRRWRGVLCATALLASLVLAACGSSGGTTYWKANFTGGTSLYMSVDVSGQQVSGWAESEEDNTFQHYDGQVNSDGTLQVDAYGGATLSISGSTMTASYSEGDIHFSKVSASAYQAAGGTT